MRPGPQRLADGKSDGKGLARARLEVLTALRASDTGGGGGGGSRGGGGGGGRAKKSPRRVRGNLGANFSNDYAGFSIPFEHWRPARIGLPQRARDFDARFVRRREPVLIDPSRRSWFDGMDAEEAETETAAVLASGGGGASPTPLAAMCALLAWGVCGWSDEYLAARGGNESVFVETKAPFTAGSELFSLWSHVEAMKFGAFVDRTLRAGAVRTAALRAGAPVSGAEPYANLYLNIQGVREDGKWLLLPPLAAFAADVSVPEFLGTWDLVSMHMWAGHSLVGAAPDDPTGSCSVLHADNFDNVIAVVRGRKRVLLVGPGDADKLPTLGMLRRVRPVGTVEFHKGGVPQLKPHFTSLDVGGPASNVSSRVPAGVRWAQVDVRAGEMLFMPAGWFHRVCSFGSHVAVNFWADPTRLERTYPELGAGRGGGGARYG